MPFLVTFSDGLAVSAIILAITAIGFEVAFFIVQTQQLYRGERESASYVADMREVLGKIEGLTTGTRDQLRDLFDRVLTAALRRSGEDVGPSALASVGEAAAEPSRVEDGISFGAWRQGELRRLLGSSAGTRELLRRVAANAEGFAAEDVPDLFRTGEGVEGMMGGAVKGMLTVGQIMELDVLDYDRDSGRLKLKPSEEWARQVIESGNEA